MVQINPNNRIRTFPNRFPRKPKKKKFYRSKYFLISILALIVVLVLILMIKKEDSVCEGSFCVSDLALNKTDLESGGFIVIGEPVNAKIYGEGNTQELENYGIQSYSNVEGYSITFKVENEYTYETININGTFAFYPGTSNFEGISKLVIFDSYEDAITYYSSFNKPYNQTSYTYNYYYSPKIGNLSYILKTTEKTFRYENNDPGSETIDYYIEDYQVYFVYNRMFFYIKVYKKDMDINKLVALSNEIIDRYINYVK